MRGRFPPCSAPARHAATASSASSPPSRSTPPPPGRRAPRGPRPGLGAGGLPPVLSSISAARAAPLPPDRRRARCRQHASPTTRRARQLRGKSPTTAAAPLTDSAAHRQKKSRLVSICVFFCRLLSFPRTFLSRKQNKTKQKTADPRGPSHCTVV